MDWHASAPLIAPASCVIALLWLTEESYTLSLKLLPVDWIGLLEFHIEKWEQKSHQFLAAFVSYFFLFLSIAPQKYVIIKHLFQQQADLNLTIS